MYLYLVRHGQSEGNARGLFFGQWDCPLTGLGREQAAQAAEKLRERSFARCCASDLSRAWETAQICLAGRPIAAEKCPALREQDMGGLERTTWQQLQERYGEERLRAFVKNWYRESLPTLEPAPVMEKRVGACVDGILRRGEDTLIVAHNGSLSLLAKHLGLFEETQLFAPEFHFAFGCYSVVRVTPEGAALEGFNL